MSHDSFTTTHSSKQLRNPLEEDNFFVFGENNNKLFFDEPQQTVAKRHLNDYDFNILKEGAYKDITDERFKLEYKISRAEDDIKQIDARIQAANDIEDFLLAENLTEKRNQMVTDLKGLVEIYNDTGFSSKISTNITTEIKKQILPFKNKLSSIANSIISKLPGKLGSIVEVKNSLTKLQNISKNVDELMSVQFPYGEAGDKYDRLSKYIAKANNIQVEISKFLK